MLQTNIDYENTAAAVVSRCLNDLTDVEADFIRQCHLSKPKQTLKAFSEKWSLDPLALKTLKADAFEKLRKSLASTNVRCMTDILWFSGDLS